MNELPEMKFIHRTCENEVTFDRDDISTGPEDWADETGEPYYFAACMYCDEDLFKFEVGIA